MRRWLTNSLRGRLVVVVVLGAAVTLGALTAGFNLVLSDSLDRDARDVVRARATALLATVVATPRGVRVRESPDDGAADAQSWVFAGPRLVERPRSAPAANLRAVRTLAGGPARFLDVHATDTRFYAVPIVRSGRRVGTLVTGVSLAPYEHSVHLALLASIVFALASLAGVALAAVWIVGRALHPVARMTADASDWSEHDLDKRFLPGEPHDELTRLAATFDGLLDRLAAGLRREQSFSAELSHELRTPLARLVAETDLALRRERTPREYRDALEAVQRAARQMDRTLETLIVAARAQADLQRGTSDAVDAARRAVAVTAEHEARDDVAVTVAAPPSPLRVGADADLVERILAPLVENGVRHATTRVVVEVHSDGGRAVFVVADDGPGVAEDDQAHIFEPGVRAGNGSARRDHPGAGLGLPLARRLARAAGGDVECVATPRGGRFRVRLPRG